ncbi:MAG TPA: sugar ABC transporter ATP-binding protein [Chloroflexota bacterium]|nr:sugar ABC transporter ATP-binding protein [Chloroflexota bacterium]
MPSIEGLSISKSFGGVRALREASFSAEQGEVHALVGENGAGKSTMIKILSGLYPPDSGQIRVHNQPVSLGSPQAALQLGMATIFQELTLLPYMTVAENLLLDREPRFGGLIRRGAMPDAAQTLLDQYAVQGLNPLELVANLTLGRRQVVEIVKTVSRQPRILFLDEPTSALAEEEVKWLFGLIADLRRRGVCMVFTSHRWNEIKGLADRITVFRNGASVGVFAGIDLSEEGAVELMTGRKLDMQYPEPPPLAKRTPVFAAHDLAGRGLRGATFTSYEGEILGVGGLAGQGQRDLFLALFGAGRFKSGFIDVRGARVRLRSPRAAIRAGIALVPEDRKTEGLLLPLSIRANLSLPILGRLSRAGIIHRRAEEILNRSIIEQLAVRTPSQEQPVGMLSGGNQQKVLLGRWLLSGARILLLYDITRGVDVATKHDIYELILRLAAEGHTLLFYSTDTEELAHICHRVIIMREGRFVAELEGQAITPEAIVAAAIRVPGSDRPLSARQAAGAPA